jgi:hypothetical protein
VVQLVLLLLLHEQHHRVRLRVVRHVQQRVAAGQLLLQVVQVMILVAEVAVVDKVVDGGQVRAGRNVRAVEHVNTLMFVACYAYSVLTRDNMRQSDVGFCFVGSYTQTINVWVGCIDTRSSTQHYYLIIVCL